MRCVMRHARTPKFQLSGPTAHSYTVTGLNNVVLPTLLNVVNNIEQVVEPESSPQSGVTIMNNIVDNIEQCGQHNIIQSCFQQLITTHNF